MVTVEESYEAAADYGTEDADTALLFWMPGDYSLPQPDLSGEWADSRTPHSLALNCGWSEGDFSFWSNSGELLQELCNAYENAFCQRIAEVTGAEYIDETGA